MRTVARRRGCPNAELKATYDARIIPTALPRPFALDVPLEDQ
jgi:hypothetical protein